MPGVTGTTRKDSHASRENGRKNQSSLLPRREAKEEEEKKKKAGNQVRPTSLPPLRKDGEDTSRIPGCPLVHAHTFDRLGPKPLYIYIADENSKAKVWEYVIISAP